MCEGEYKNDQKIKDFGRKLLDYAMPEGFEKVEQLIPTLLHPDDPWDFNWTDNTISWPAQEAIIAYRVAYHMFGEEKYKRLSEIVEKAAMDYFADREQGRWYINIKRGLPPVAQRTDKSGHLEGPFHLERMLLGLIILEEDGSIARYIK
jgi:mannose/cellobiose epimerase-like protein (N-acyl-D-glucosamine 2-epimerase family)